MDAWKVDMAEKLRATAENLMTLSTEIEAPVEDQSVLAKAADVLFRYVELLEKDAPL